MVTLKSQELSQGLTPLWEKHQTRSQKGKTSASWRLPGTEKTAPSWEKHRPPVGSTQLGRDWLGQKNGVLTPGRSGRGGPGPEARLPGPRGWDLLFWEQGSAELQSGL